MPPGALREPPVRLMKTSSSDEATGCVSISGVPSETQTLNIALRISVSFSASTRYSNVPFSGSATRLTEAQRGDHLSLSAVDSDGVGGLAAGVSREVFGGVVRDEPALVYDDYAPAYRLYLGQYV